MRCDSVCAVPGTSAPGTLEPVSAPLLAALSPARPVFQPPSQCQVSSLPAAVLYRSVPTPLILFKCSPIYFILITCLLSGLTLSRIFLFLFIGNIQLIRKWTFPKYTYIPPPPGCRFRRKYIFMRKLSFLCSLFITFFSSRGSAAMGARKGKMYGLGKTKSIIYIFFVVFYPQIIEFCNVS